MIKSAICEMLGIRYPVFQGGMAWVADGRLAAAVSEGGGLGIIGAGNAPGDYVRQQIRIARGITDKPIGVNIMLLSPFAEEVAKVVIEENVEVVTTGAGNPSKYIKEWLAAGIRVIPVVASVAMARLMTRLGASARCRGRRLLPCRDAVRIQARHRHSHRRQVLRTHQRLRRCGRRAAFRRRGEIRRRVQAPSDGQGLPRNRRARGELRRSFPQASRGSEPRHV